MKYCQRCLYPQNHPLGIVFDDQGVCSGCRVHEEKDSIDWVTRKLDLKRIFDAYRDQSDSQYDCIVPVSGARDSYFIVHTLKREFGLKPLLVTYNQQYNMEVGIRNLAYLRTCLDCDLLTLTVDPKSAKRATHASLQQAGSIYWHCIAGQTVFPVQTAVRFKIPLIVWGAHQGIDQVGMFSHLDNVEMTRKYRKEHDLMGFEAEDLVGIGDVREEDLLQYFYPNNKKIESVGVRGIYLNNFIRWDTKAQHEKMIARYGYESVLQSRTFDTYNDVDSHHYSGLHDLIKYCKWGYGKVVDHASREVRFGRLTREEAIDLVTKYMYKAPPDTKLLLNWLSISEKDLWSVVDAHRDPSIWHPNSQGEWEVRDTIEKHRFDAGIDNARLNHQPGDCNFLVSPRRKISPDSKDYILVGRGFEDAFTHQVNQMEAE